MAYSHTTRPQTGGGVILVPPQTTSVTPTIISLKYCHYYVYALTLDPFHAYKMPYFSKNKSKCSYCRSRRKTCVLVFPILSYSKFC